MKEEAEAEAVLLDHKDRLVQLAILVILEILVQPVILEILAQPVTQGTLEILERLATLDRLVQMEQME